MSIFYLVFFVEEGNNYLVVIRRYLARVLSFFVWGWIIKLEVCSQEKYFFYQVRFWDIIIVIWIIIVIAFVISEYIY